MKKISPLILMLLFAWKIQAQNTKWAKAFGAGNADVVTGITEDTSGNTYITGWYTISTNIGGSNFTSKGNNDIFIAKLDTAGKVLWAVSEGGNGDDRGYGIVIDISGNIVITGIYSNNFTFGTGANAKAITSAGNSDVMIASYSPAGVFQGIATAGGPYGDRANAIATDDNGNFVITGYYGAPGGGGPGGGTMSFGTNQITSIGVQDAFVAAINSKGVWQWAKGYGSTRGSEVGNDVAVYGKNIYVAGAFRDSTNFGVSILVGTAGTNDAFILRLNDQGVEKNVVQGKSTLVDAGNGITIDNLGNIYACGSFGAPAGGGGGGGGATSFTIGSSTITGTGSEAYIAAFDDKLNLQWAKSYGGANTDAFNRIAFGNGGLFVGGTFINSTTIGTNNLTATGALGLTDVMVASMDTAGNAFWAIAMGGSNSDEVRRLYADDNGNQYITGQFNIGGNGTPNAQFGNVTLTPAGAADGYVVRFLTCTGLSQKVTYSGPTNFCQSGSLTMTVSSGAASYQWYYNGSPVSGAIYDTFTVFAAGTYYCAMANSQGCQLNSATTTVNIGSVPSANLSITSKSICQGDSVILTASSGNGYKYKWYFNGAAITGWVTNSNYYAKNAGNYKVEIDNYGCTAMSAEDTLTVLVSPTLAIKANGPTSFCSGDSVLLTGDTNSTWFYQWQRLVGNTWNILPNGNTDSYMAKLNGSHRLVVTTMNGCNIASNIITLNVGGSVNATLAGIPGSTTHCFGDSVRFIINFGGGGGGGYQYRWVKDGDTIPGFTARNYTVKTTGTYHGVIISGNCKSVTRDTLVTFINSGASISPAFAANLCQNDTVKFIATGDIGSTFQWTLNGTNIVGANNSTYNATTAGNYACVISLSGCSFKTPATTVTLFAPPTAPSIIQNGNNLASSLAATSYQWYLANNPIPGANTQFLYAFSSGFYMVEITDGNGCKARSPLYSFNYTANGIVAIAVGKLNIYPNPSNGLFNLVIPGSDKITVTVSNMEGKEIYTQSSQGIAGGHMIDLSPIDNGIYIVRVVCGDKTFIDRIEILKN